MSGKGWWTCGVENGHWVLVVSKEDFQIGLDAWGYREGELKGRVHALIPEGPSVITARKIAEQLYLYEGKVTHIFVKAIQRCLRELRGEGFARSVPHGEGRQLGWLLKTATSKSEAVVFETPTSVTPAPPRPKLSLKATGRIAPGLGMQGKVLKYLPRAPGMATVESIAQHIEAECQLEAGQAVKAVTYQLADLEKKRLATANAGGWSRVA